MVQDSRRGAGHGSEPRVRPSHVRSSTHEVAPLDRQRALEAASSEGVVVLDAQGLLTQANPRAEAMLGWSERDLGQPVAGLLERLSFAEADGAPQPAHRWPGLRALAGQTVRALDVAFHREGRTIWLSTTAMPLASPPEGPGGAVVCMSDVTGLRTLEHHHEQLLRLISHDIRNPLTSVHLNAQLLNKVLTDRGLEREQRLASVVIGAARRLDVMIQELVDSARVRSGQLRLDLRPLSVERLIPEILARSASTLDTSRVRLLLPDEPVVITADTVRLERVLTSLLALSLQNCPDLAEVTLRVARSDDEIRFALGIPGRGQARDEGPLPPRSPFARGDHDHNFGLGLFVARMLVERHGGRLWVEGNPGHDTTIAFAMPVAGPLR